MSNASSAKGNPASHRMSNANLKAKRARSWAKNQKAKEARKAEQERRRKANQDKRKQGLLTDYEVNQMRRLIKHTLRCNKCLNKHGYEGITKMQMACGDEVMNRREFNAAVAAAKKKVKAS